MTNEVHIALVERLKRDELLNPMLGKFDDRAAIFGFRPAPELVGLDPNGKPWDEWPFVIVEPGFISEPLQDKTAPFAEVSMNIAVLTKNTGDPNVVGEPADYIYESLWDAGALSVPGFSVVVNDPSPPGDLSGENYLGRFIEYRIQVSRD